MGNAEYMGTIDFALGRDIIAMKLFLLALALPLAAAGFDANTMMQMMQMMNMAKGWGANGQQQNMGGNAGGVMQQQQQQMQQQQQWQGMTNSADCEAYLKWCEENKVRQQEQMKQQELLNQFKAMEEKRKQEMEKEKIEMEAKERQQNMMAQWKSWEQKMKMSSNFENLGYEIMEVKGKYYYMVVFEFLKFCKCTDKASQIQAFFSHEGMSGSKSDYEEFDLSDLGITQAQSSDPLAVARALLNISKEDQVKAYFSGLATSMCEAANAYFDQVETWEKTYNFIEKLSI